MYDYEAFRAKELAELEELQNISHIQAMLYRSSKSHPVETEPEVDYDAWRKSAWKVAMDNYDVLKEWTR